MNRYLELLLAAIGGAVLAAGYVWLPELRRAYRSGLEQFNAVVACRRRGYHRRCAGCLEHCFDCGALAPGRRGNTSDAWAEFPAFPEWARRRVLEKLEQIAPAVGELFP